MKKIKNSVQSISPDISVILMCIALLVACPVRIFQMVKNMDAATGFFMDYSHITITVLYAVLAVAAVLILALSFLSARIPAAIAPAGRRIPLGIASFLFSAGLFYDAIKNYIPAEEESATIIQNTNTVTLLSHAHAILALLACCYFLVFAISYISGSSFHKKLKILSLAPLAWAVIGVLERITVIISIMRISELFLELCALVCLMTFFLSFARVVSDVNGKDSMWSTIACGIVSAMLILSYSIPRVMLHATYNSRFIVDGYPVDFATLGCAVFIIAFVITVLRSGYSVEDVAKMNEELEAAAAAAKDEEETATEDVKTDAAEEAVTEEAVTEATAEEITEETTEEVTEASAEATEE